MVSFGFLHAFVSSVGQTFFISLFAPEVCAAFAIQRTAFGSYYGLATLLSGLAIVVVGAWIDRVSLRIYAGAAVIALAAAVALLGWAPNLLFFVPALFLVRFLGQGVMSHINLASTSRFFETSRGKALGLTLLGHPLGEAFLPTVVVLGIAALGWRSTLAWAAVALAFIVAPLAQLTLLRRDPHPEAFFDEVDRRAGSAERLNGSGRTSWTRAEVLRSPGFYLILPFWVMPGLLITGFLFHQLSLADEFGWSHAWYTSSLVAFAISRAATSFAAGPIVDRVGADRLLLISFVPFMLGIVVLIFLTGPYVAPLYLALAGTLGFSATVKTTFLADLFGVKHIGAVRSVLGVMTESCVLG